MHIATTLLAVALTFSAIETTHAAPATDNMEGVRAALRLKNYPKAFELLASLARTANADAEYTLGLLYLNGLGTDADARQAREWIHQAAEHGDADAAYSLASMLASESPDRQTEVQQWLHKAADKGSAMARMALEKGVEPYQFQPD